MSASVDRVPGQPTLFVRLTTATMISIYWMAASGSVVDSYEVMWQRAASVCTNEDEGTTMSVAGGCTSVTLIGQEEDSSYSITVIATNAAGSAVSNTVTAVTGEAG